MSMYYYQEQFLKTPVGNNAISFDQRKRFGSDCLLRIAPLKEGVLDEIRLERKHTAYEYCSEVGQLMSFSGLENFLKIDLMGKDLYIIDNHNHAFVMRWRSYLAGQIDRGAQLIHIDQHSDLRDPMFLRPSLTRKSSLTEVDSYANEVLTIADFIKAALTVGLINEYEMILTEFSLCEYVFPLPSNKSIIVDIDMDFRAPEMGIISYRRALAQVMKLIMSESVGCVTIATSPGYIDQDLALSILNDLMKEYM